MDTKENSQAKEISNWLEENFIKWCEAEEIVQILNEINLLTQFLPPQYKSELKVEYEALNEWVANRKTTLIANNPQILSFDRKAIELKSFKKELKNRYHHFKPLYLILFLISRSDSSKLNIIRSLYFFICLRLVVLTDFNSRIETTLNECRFLTTSTRNFLIQFLPNVEDFDILQELLDCLHQNQKNNHYSEWQNISSGNFEEDLTKFRNKLLSPDVPLISDEAKIEINHRISLYLYEFMLPIEFILKNESGITRITDTTYQVAKGPTYGEDTTGNTVNDLVNISKKIKGYDAFEVDERQDNETESFEQVNITTPTNYYLDLVSAEGQINNRRKKAMNQVTDVNKAHSDEIRVLISFITDLLTDLDFDILEKIYIEGSDSEAYILDFDLSHQSALYLLLLLMTGMEKTFLSNDLTIGYNSYKYELSFSPARSQIQEDWDKSLCPDNTRSLYLFLPKYVGLIHSEMIQNTDEKALEAIQDQVKQDLRVLNKKHNIRLSFNKILSYLPHVLTQCNIDQALISVLINSPVHHLSALPYYNVSQYDLYRCQLMFANHLTGLINDKRNLGEVQKLFELPDDKITDYWDKNIGTALAVEESKLHEVILKLVNQVKDSLSKLKHTQLGTVVTFHNKFIDYLYIMLSVASGYRPVREPFGRLEHIDTRTGVYFISDKEVQRDAVGRFIYLPNNVCAQIDEFIKFLKLSGSILTRIGSKLGDVYQSILNNDIGLITYLKLDQPSNTVIEQPLNNAYLEKRMQPYISLPLNWNRHFIRSLKEIDIGKFSYDSAFGNNPLGYDVVSAWMGHSDELGYNFYDRYSGLKRSELKEFSVAINELMVTIGFEVIIIEDA